MRRAYLTIDDSPSARTDDLVDFLSARGAPALLFCRGDLLERNPAPVIRAIRKGFVIGNHGYEHIRASRLGFEATGEGINRTDALIDAAYAAAGIRRPGRYHRFAYLDRGMGAWFVDPAAVPAQHRSQVEHLIARGIGNDPAQTPTAEGHALTGALQAHLRKKKYERVPFKGVTHPFYTQSGMADTLDALFTTSTADWSITARHRGRWGHETVDDLKAMLDGDENFAREETAHIVLAHDQEEIHDAVCALVSHMQTRKVCFESI